MKCKKTKFVDKAVKSPPSRGAWIEIVAFFSPSFPALRRPPRGGRGLKLEGMKDSVGFLYVAPLAGGVD